MSNCDGTPSIIIKIHFLITGKVVAMTIIENKKVHIGSAYQASG
jgi:hypothetical protein